MKEIFINNLHFDDKKLPAKEFYISVMSKDHPGWFLFLITLNIEFKIEAGKNIIYLTDDINIDKSNIIDSEQLYSLVESVKIFIKENIWKFKEIKNKLYVSDELKISL